MSAFESFGNFSLIFYFSKELNYARSPEKVTATTPSKLCGDLDDLYFVKASNRKLKQDKSLLELQLKACLAESRKSDQISYEKQKESFENVKLYDRLKELETERNELNKQRSSSCVARNLVYPIAMLLLLLLTSITVLLVMQNTIELLIGIKALPLSSRVSRNCYHKFNLISWLSSNLL